MSKIVLDEQATAPDTPGAGKVAVYADASGILSWRDDAGVIRAAAAAASVVGARVYNSAGIAVATGTLTTLTFNSERFDTDGLHSTSTNTSRLTAPVAGKYLIIGQVSFSAMPTAIQIANILLNGTTIIGAERRNSTPSPNSTQVTVSTIYELSATDYVELTVQHSSGEADSILALPNYSPEFSMVLLSS